MGLDARALAVRGDIKVEICYWRKHYSLNQLVFALDNEDDDPTAWFDNYDIGVIGRGPIELGVEELDTVEHFSQYFKYDHRNSMEKDLEFVSQARDFLEKGWGIEYESC